jgi:hypothetical protein
VLVVTEGASLGTISTPVDELAATDESPLGVAVVEEAGAEDGVPGAELHGAALPCEEGGVEVVCQVELACTEEPESD